MMKLLNTHSTHSACLLVELQASPAHVRGARACLPALGAAQRTRRQRRRADLLHIRVYLRFRLGLIVRRQDPDVLGVWRHRGCTLKRWLRRSRARRRRGRGGPRCSNGGRRHGREERHHDRPVGFRLVVEEAKRGQPLELSWRAVAEQRRRGQKHHVGAARGGLQHDHRVEGLVLHDISSLRLCSKESG